MRMLVVDATVLAMRDLDPIWKHNELAGLESGWEEEAHADCQPGECQACDPVPPGQGDRS